MAKKHKWIALKLPLEFPDSIDLEERAKHTAFVQTAIGQVAGEFLAGGKPVVMAVSTCNLPSMGDNRRMIVDIMVREATEEEVGDLHLHHDLPMVGRCTGCGEIKLFDHKCAPRSVDAPVS